MPNVQDYRYNSNYHKPALPGQEFSLRLAAPGVLKTSSHTRLMGAIFEALAWKGSMRWAEIVDFEGQTTLSQEMMARIWKADVNHYATGGHAPFKITGPTLNPTFIEEYHSQGLYGAIEFALGWFEDYWNDPYWVAVFSPNGRLVIPRKVLERMYHAQLKAAGWTITEYVVQPSDMVVVGNGYGVRLSETLSARRVI